MDLRGSIPTFVLHTPGKVNDVKVMDKVSVESGSLCLKDKGYVAFEKLHKYFGGLLRYTRQGQYGLRGY